MNLLFQALEVHGSYDDGGALHWERTAQVSPIMALAGLGLYDDAASLDQVTEAAGQLGWRLLDVERGGGRCNVHLQRPSVPSRPHRR